MSPIRPRRLLRVARVREAPGGSIAKSGVRGPTSRFWRFWWWLYTVRLLPGRGHLSGGREWSRVGRFLGPNISNHYRRYSVAWTVQAW